VPKANAREWLEGWVNGNLNLPGHQEKKAAMRDGAAACAEQAKAAGISIAELKEAAGGDLEIYLLDRQNELTDADRGSGKEAGQ
jgi:hypothetical protein